MKTTSKLISFGLLSFLLFSTCRKEETYVISGHFMEGTHMGGWEGMHMEAVAYDDQFDKIVARLGKFVTGKDGNFSFSYQHVSERGASYIALQPNIEYGYVIYSGDQYPIRASAWMEINKTIDKTIYAANQGWVRVHLRQKAPLKQGDTLFFGIYGNKPKGGNDSELFEKLYTLPNPNSGLLDSFKFTGVGFDCKWGHNRQEFNNVLNGLPPWYEQHIQRQPKGDPYVTDITIEY